MKHLTQNIAKDEKKEACCLNSPLFITLKKLTH